MNDGAILHGTSKTTSLLTTSASKSARSYARSSAIPSMIALSTTSKLRGPATRIIPSKVLGEAPRLAMMVSGGSEGVVEATA